MITKDGYITFCVQLMWHMEVILRVQINIISGFFEAGKTSFIKNLLQKDAFKDGKKTILLCCEQGVEEYPDRILERTNTTLIEIDNIHKLNKGFFSSIINEHSPARILIEYNGTWKIGDFLKINLPSNCCINKIVSIADASTFQVYMGNMGKMMSEQFSNSDIVLLNRGNSLDSLTKDNIVRTLKSINRQAKLLFYIKTVKDSIINEITDIYEVQGLYKGLKAFSIVIPLALLYLALITIKMEGFPGELKKVQALNTVFVSILIQALPFVLIGVLISSLLQIFISDEKLVRMFTKFKWIGFPLAIILGVFFPVCDCAMAPITARLVRKGVPLHYVITFMLAAPAVNPIVITSTVYAFPNDHKIVLLRVFIGITIAVIAGVLIKFGGPAKEYAINQTSVDTACASGYLGEASNGGTLGKTETLFRHAGLEFFNVTKYVVIGALITSVIQTFISKNALADIGANPILALLVMLLAASLMSVCSTSNAFIAKSFSYSFPLYSVICFMVMGPMLDLKNILMLSSGFKKKFLAELVFMLLVIAVFVFAVCALIV